MTNRRPISTLLPIILATIFAGCSKPPPEQAKGPREPVKVKTAAIQRREMEKLVDVIGTLYGDEEALISAKVNGRVKAIPVDLGDRVASESLLAQIDPVDFELEVNKRKNAVNEALAKLGLTQMPGNDFDVTSVVTVMRAKAQSENAQAKLERARKLFEQAPPLISEQDFADLQTEQKVAANDFEVAKLEVKSQLATAQSRQSELESAEQQLRDTRVIAPKVDGNRKYAVAQRSVSVGEYVREGSAMFKLILDDRVKFRGNLPERFFSQVAVNQSIRVYLTGDDKPIFGSISRISPSVDLATRTFQIEASFDNSTFKLRPGGFVRGEIVIGSDKNIPQVPKEAIYSFAGSNKVFTTNGTEAAEHEVTLGREENGKVAIVKGLTNETDVIITNLGQLSNKAPIELDSSPTSAPAP